MFVEVSIACYTSMRVFSHSTFLPLDLLVLACQFFCFDSKKIFGQFEITTSPISIWSIYIYIFGTIAQGVSSLHFSLSTFLSGINIYQPKCRSSRRSVSKYFTFL